MKQRYYELITDIWSCTKAYIDSNDFEVLATKMHELDQKYNGSDLYKLVSGILILITEHFNEREEQCQK